MVRHRFPRDWGLSVRMVATLFFLGLLWVFFVVALVALQVSLVVVLVVAAGLFFGQYFFADRIALIGMGARQVDPKEAPELHGIVDRLCALADMPKPRVAIADSDIPNAFATGRDQRHAVVAVTTGLLSRLEEQEVEAVLAHELSHVAHRDMAVMTIASFLAILAGILMRFTLYAGMFGGFGNNRRNDQGNQAAVAIVVVLVVSAVVYALGFLLTRALSRYRELAADRSAAILTGRPSVLSSALVKVSGQMSRIPTRDLRAAEPFNAFFFSPAVSPGFSLSSVFSTHPSLERRLEQLTRIEAELGRVR